MWHKEAIELSLQGFNAREISETLGQNYDAVRSHIKRWRKKNGVSRDKAGRLVDSEAPELVKANGDVDVSYNSLTNSYTYEHKIKIPKGEMITPEKVLKFNNLDPKEWEVTFFKFNNWQGFVNKDEFEKVDLYQVKLTVKPITKSEITFDDIDEYFATKEFKNDIPKCKAFPTRQGLVLQINLADVHCGLLSWRNETNNDYDLTICRDRLLECIGDAVERAKKEPIKKVYLCSLGDFLHIDNDNNTTTKGTLQQADGRLSKIFDFAVDTLETTINMLLTLNVPVEYVNTCGNHDRTTNYFLAKVIEAIYRNNPNVILDIKPMPMKAIHFGKVLIGLCHGDLSKKNKGNWIIADYRKWVGESDFIEEHSGHWHTEMVQEMRNGIMCRSVMSSCGQSYYEFQQGYRSQKGVQSFLWDEEKGLRSIWYYNL